MKKLTPISLKGEPATDKAFRGADGRHYRVRVLPVAETFHNDRTVTVPFAQALDVTITRLDSKKKVEKDSKGRAIIVAQTRLTIDAETFNDDHPETTPEATLNRLIGKLIDQAANLSAGRDGLALALKSWGVE